MPKKLLKKYMPDPERIRNMKALSFLGDRLHSPNLWHLNRRSVARAFAIGLWAMYTPPLPWQQIIAGILAVYLEANVPIAVSLVWITNPLTWIPLYYVPYRLGLFVLGMDGISFSAFSDLFSVEKALELGTPLLLGCFILMNVGAVAGYFGIQYLWRRSVLHQLQLRKFRNGTLDSAFMANTSHSDYRKLLAHRDKHQHTREQAQSQVRKRIRDR